MMYLEDNFGSSPSFSSSDRDLRLRRASAALSLIFGESVSVADVDSYGREAARRRQLLSAPRRSELRDLLSFERHPYMNSPPEMN